MSDYKPLTDEDRCARPSQSTSERPMTDLVSRLRALADEMDFGWRPPLLREAAEALAEAETALKKYREPYGWEGKRIEDERARAEKAEAEVAALKKALQDMNVTGWRELRDKADIAIAEAAALRDIAQDLCDFNAKYLDEMRSKETWAVEGTLEESPFVTRFRHALSQPGPGAAYQERLRETESKFATQSHNLNVMNERLKKLEAVAVAVKANAALFSDDEPLTFENCEPIRLALAALGEKA